MSDTTSTHSAFLGQQLLASGSLQDVALSAFRALTRDPNASVLLFSNETGNQVDLDLHGTEHEVATRHPPTHPLAPPAMPRSTGRADARAWAWCHAR